MIHAYQQRDSSFIVQMDPADQIAISRLADAYCICNEDMLVGCINKGMENVGRQVKENAAKENESHGCPHSG